MRILTRIMRMIVMVVRMIMMISDVLFGFGV